MTAIDKQRIKFGGRGNKEGKLLSLCLLGGK